jgi:copper chaperone CopZ
MNSISKVLMATAVLLSVSACHAQSIPNARTETVKIYGNCDMCEAAIEKAGNIKKVAQVDWDKDTKMATLTYNSQQTTQAEIMKRIALAGYDSDSFLAPNEAYAQLPECCQYQRVNKTEVAKTEQAGHYHDMQAAVSQEGNQLQAIFDGYFALKNALVQSDGKAASAQAKSLETALNAVQMNKLAPEEHTAWMKDLSAQAKPIAETQDLAAQREHFMALSKNMYELLKVAKQATPTYYQFCPMANDGKGANWLSKESTVKNPYYGSQMLTCGKTVETIKQ